MTDVNGGNGSAGSGNGPIFTKGPSGPSGQDPNKKWWKKKRFNLPIAVFVVLVAIGAAGGNSNSSQNVKLTTDSHVITTTSTAQAAAALVTTTAAPTTTTTMATTTTPAPLVATTTTPPKTTTSTIVSSSPTSSYTNVNGNTIESPDGNTSGATGVCNDGTYTHAVHHQGACSSHGGVNHWL